MEPAEQFWTPVQSPHIPQATVTGRPVAVAARQPPPNHAETSSPGPSPRMPPAPLGRPPTPTRHAPVPREFQKPDTPTRTPAKARSCAKCNQPIAGHFVRALGQAWHLECFVCHDCGVQCAAKFFPFDSGHDRGEAPLCEKCYFRRQDLLCYRCGGSLRGSYITALDRKYHVEHFTCSLCPTVFGPDDSYFEHASDVYCRYHYATLHAARCEGCHAAILKQFVETYRGGREQQWHPECYMIFKFWNVKVPRPPKPMETPVDASSEQKEALLKHDAETDDLILRIWTTLCGFEEQCAAEISALVQLAVAGDFDEAHVRATNLVDLVNVLFSALPNIDNLGKEPKTLCRKIVSYMSLLSKTRSLNSHERVQGLAKDLLALASGMAHYLKVLIRYGLAATLNAPQHPAAVAKFLHIVQKPPASLRPDLSGISPFSSDRCAACSKPVEDRCFRLRRDQTKLWHASPRCFACADCHKPLLESKAGVYANKKLRCTDCSRAIPSEFRELSRLQQYVLLLHVALSRLDLVLRHPKPDTSTENQAAKSAPALPTSPSLIDNDKAASTTNLPSGDMVSNGTSETRGESLQRTSTLLHTKKSLTLDDIRRIVAAEQSRPRRKTEQTILESSSPSTVPPSGLYFGNLDSARVTLVREVAVILLAKQHSLEPVQLQQQQHQKQTLWEKVGKALVGSGGRGGRRQAVFGAPLEQLIERYGVESRLGVLPSYVLRIPGFVDDCVAAMRQKDMSVEGVFRKNGNIRRLREFADKVDRVPDESGVLADENPVQLAALLKKFLRDLPEPLLGLGGGRMTKLWLHAGGIEEPSARQRALQFCVCALPRPNRDLLEVLVHFWGWTASFASGDGDADTGSKMDAQNLAGVLAPTLLFPQVGEDDTDHEVPADMYIRAIEPVRLLIQHGALVAQVPPDITKIMDQACKLPQPLRKQDLAELVSSALSSGLIPKLRS